jgi:stalled ribosome rescue protein Dom34
MKSKVGLWIDHRKTVVVRLSGDTEEIEQIASGTQKHVRYSGETEDISPEDQRDRQFVDHLSKYYDEVISHVRDAESILVMGPGEAKGEFVNRLHHEGLGGLIVGVETVDKMTDRQIAALVRQQFLARK